jgi:LemA protein
VLNQYQRRADLVPNLVATVKGEANFEQETLTKVVEARAKATSMQVTPEVLNNPEAFQKFQQAQGELSGALSRLMVVSERYPDLKANQGFRDLRVQLEGTENRITVARNRYIQSVQSTTCWRAASRPTSPPWCSATSPSPASRCRTKPRSRLPPTVDFGAPKK